MNWKDFSRSISRSHYIYSGLQREQVAQTLANRVELTFVGLAPHEWYGHGATHGSLRNGYRYVDQDRSYVGDDKAFCSEASSCVLVVLVDPYSKKHFLAHIAADSDQKDNYFQTMIEDMKAFFHSINYDMGRPELYLFSQNMHKLDDGDYELKNLMTVLSTVLPDASLRWLALSTYLFEGLDNMNWCPYSTVRVNYENAKHKLLVSFAKA